MFTTTFSTRFAKLAAIMVPAAALLIALSPSSASADLGGPVLVISPNASVISGVEVAGALSNGAVLSCVFSDTGASVQTCVLPAGLGADAALIAAPNATDGNVAVAGVTADAMGAASYSCEFDASADGPQTCSINA
jgi:hypothetical protein